MSAELERRLQEALDAQQLSDDLLAEVAGHPDLESLIDQDAGLRAMPRREIDFSESVLGRLDEELEDIPGLFDAPHFETDLAPAPAELAPAAAPARPISLDDERRKRSAAPFLLTAAAVIGLVTTGTLMTLNAPASDQVAMEASVQPAPSGSAGMPMGYAEETSARGAMVEAAPEPEPEAPAEAADADREPVIADNIADPASNLSNLAEGSEASAELAYDLAYEDEQPRRSRRAAGAPAAAAPVRSAMSSARGGASLERDRDDSLTSSQQRTVARIESCLPDHIQITRVRQSADGRRVIGVDTSEPLSDEVNECVSGVLDTFPRARRRRRPTSMSVPAATSTGGTGD